MELIRAKPIQRVKFHIPIEEAQQWKPELEHHVDQLKGFARAVLLRSSGTGYNKLLITELIREAVWRKRGAELSAHLDQHLKETIDSMLNSIESGDAAAQSQGADADERNNEVLKKVEECWCHLRAALNELMQVCAMLEEAAAGSFSVWTVAMQYFKQNLESKQKMQKMFLAAMLNRITEYRDGGEVVFCQLRNMVEMFSFVDLYDVFEEKLVAETRCYYRNTATLVLSQSPVTEAYRILQKKIEREGDCCRKFLMKPSVQKVLDVVMVQVLQLNAEALMDQKELNQIISGGDRESMKVLLALYGDTEWSAQLHDAIFDAAQSIGDDITAAFMKSTQGTPTAKAPKDCWDFVMKLYWFKNQLDVTVRDTLPANVDFKAREQTLWHKILNSNEQTMEAITFALASYTAGAPHGMGATQFMEDDCGMPFILHVFRALANKTNYETHFRVMLSSRLLYEQQLSDVQEQVVAQLKAECGVSYVSKLEALINDYNNSRKVYLGFTEANGDLIRASAGDISQFHAVVLSHDTWLRGAKIARPQADDVFKDCEVDGFSEVDVPVEVNEGSQLQAMKRLQGKFAEFYAVTHKNRSISYLPEFGSAELEMELQGKTYKLNLSVCQAYCLLALNNMDVTTLAALQEIMGVEYNEILMRKHLAPLCAGENPVLAFVYHGLNFDNCSDDDRFGLNPQFMPDAPVVDLQYKDAVFETHDVEEVSRSSIEDLTPAVEATIVRHLKTKLEDTTSNVFKVCVDKHASVDRFDFNKIVDSLVERDFVKFSPQNDVLYYVP
ncbi:Cullin family protein, putative [Babesia caballi]|uniref:Cullin family protein, putative n=1 Tax=Babesia caballi TaxID=5871 RepID=A0AAV4LQS4_BABCB|nr:Cullin family protein, putative [Babesia caballi]